MAKYSRGGVIVVAALCLGGILFPLTSSAPTTSPSVSSDAVSEQTGTKQIAVDNKLCLETGIRVLTAKGNNAVDAAVATLLCLGVVNFQSSGIGGGMVMVVAKKNLNGGQPNVTVIDARVVAPQSVNDPAGVPYVDDETLALIGKAMMVLSDSATLDICNNYYTVSKSNIIKPKVSVCLSLCVYVCSLCARPFLAPSPSNSLWILGVPVQVIAELTSPVLLFADRELSVYFRFFLRGRPPFSNC